jgi:hypothetical protein
MTKPVDLLIEPFCNQTELTPHCRGAGTLLLRTGVATYAKTDSWHLELLLEADILLLWTAGILLPPGWNRHHSVAES